MNQTNTTTSTTTQKTTPPKKPTPASHAKKPTPTSPKKKATAEKTHTGPQQINLPDAIPLRLMPLGKIRAADQVRTAFDDASLAELAADIAANGVLQPILIRPEGPEAYVIVAGERRFRAAGLAGLVAIPAIVTDVTAEQASALQLAENIQREELSLADTARAVRKLYDQLGSLQTVADRCHKSKAWASKHLATTYDDFGWMAREALEDGISEDLEILHALSKLQALNAYKLAHEAFEALKAGQLSRARARELLEQAKTPKPTPTKAQTLAPDAAWPFPKEKQNSAAPLSPPPAKEPPPWAPQTSIAALSTTIRLNAIDIAREHLRSRTPNQLQALQAHVEALYDQWATIEKRHGQTHALMLLMTNYDDELNTRIAIAGILRHSFDLEQLINTCEGFGNIDQDRYSETFGQLLPQEQE